MEKETKKYIMDEESLRIVVLINGKKKGVFFPEPNPL